MTDNPHDILWQHPHVSEAVWKQIVENKDIKQERFNSPIDKRTKIVIEEMFNYYSKQSEKIKDIIRKNIPKFYLSKYFAYIFMSLVN